MTDSNRSRPVIDLDELERQLREASAPRPVAPAAASGREDPLAELARIVGQDDPYRPARPAAAARPAPVAPPRFEPSDFEAELAALSRGEPFVPSRQDAFAPEPAPTPQPAAPSFPPPPPFQAAPAVQPAPSFQASLAQAEASRPEAVPAWDLRTTSQDGFGTQRQSQRQVQHDAYAPSPAELEPNYEPEGQLPPHSDEYAEPPRRSRRGLYAALVVLGVAVIGVSAGFAVRNSISPTRVAGGAPPVIKAETGPSKVAPDNPGGVEVPNQDRQIYNKGIKEDPKAAKMVGGEEQPVDVAAAARPGPRVILPPTTGPDTATTGSAAPASTVELPKPPQTTSLPPGLGEPRKVKTVSVRPDGTIIEGGADAAAPVARTTVASLAGGDAGVATGGVPAPTPRPVTTTTAAAPKPAAAVPAQTPAATATTTASTPKPTVPKPVPTQVASTQPVAPIETTETAGSGGWAVQLAAPPTEQEARDTATRLTRRFAGELGDLKPGIRKAEVSGKTIYRVRVGSLSKDDAASLCEKLKAAGGQCFIAKN